jgi:hypothetical protein
MQWFHILMRDVIVLKEDAMGPHIDEGCDLIGFTLKMRRLAMWVRAVVTGTSKEDAMVPYIDEGCDCFHTKKEPTCCVGKKCGCLYAKGGCNASVF